MLSDINELPIAITTSVVWRRRTEGILIYYAIKPIICIRWMNQFV